MQSKAPNHIELGSHHARSSAWLMPYGTAQGSQAECQNHTRCPEGAHNGASSPPVIPQGNASVKVQENQVRHQTKQGSRGSDPCNRRPYRASTGPTQVLANAQTQKGGWQETLGLGTKAKAPGEGEGQRQHLGQLSNLAVRDTKKSYATGSPAASTGPTQDPAKTQTLERDTGTPRERDAGCAWGKIPGGQLDIPNEKPAQVPGCLAMDIIRMPVKNSIHKGPSQVKRWQCTGRNAECGEP